MWLPGDRIANVRGIREQRVMTDDDLDVGGVRYERVEPMRRWRLTADAEAEVHDLDERRHARVAAGPATSRWT